MRTALSLIAWTVCGALLGGIAAYLAGAAAGLAMTFYNNNYSADAAQGSYLWWANFVGYILAVFAVVPGAVVGLAAKLIKIATRERPA